MTMTDPVADLLTRLRNGLQGRRAKIDIPASKLKLEIVRILHDEGFVEGFTTAQDDRQGVISVFLKYGPERQPAITSMSKVSTPGCRVYCKKGEIPQILNGLGINILSTSKGVMTGQKAHQAGLGGEVLCNVY